MSRLLSQAQIAASQVFNISHRPFSASAHLAAGAANPLKYYYESDADNPYASRLKKSKKEFRSIKAELDVKYPIDNNPFFDYALGLSRGVGVNAAQFDSLRANYFYRTLYTIVSVAQSVAKLVAAGDFVSVAKAAKNMYEEGGSGNVNDVHLKLLEESFNIHGQTIFGLLSLRAKDAQHSPYLLEATKKFRQLQEKILLPEYPYPEMMGRFWAHEKAADRMLQVLAEAFFESFKGHYPDEKSYKSVMRYFEVHRDDSKEGGDIEARHARDAEDIAAAAIASDPKGGAKLFRNGAEDFFKSQAKMWESLLENMRALEKHGVRIVPNKLILPSVERAKPVDLEGAPKKKAGVPSASAALRDDFLALSLAGKKGSEITR